MADGYLGGDILADKTLSQEEVRRALSQWLSLSPDSILTYKDWGEIPDQPHEGRVLCQIRSLPGGDFRTVMGLPDSILHGLPRIAAATALCKLLGCRLLIDNGSINPYSWLLVSPGDNVKQVYLEPEAFDRDECVINEDMSK